MTTPSALLIGKGREKNEIHEPRLFSTVRKVERPRWQWIGLLAAVAVCLAIEGVNLFRKNRLPGLPTGEKTP